MSQYSTGTVSINNGSATVTGSGTLFLTNVNTGDSFTIASTGVVYDVASVDSDTQITLSVNYAGVTASGVVYAIGTGFTVPDSFPEMSQGDIETATIFTRAMRKIQGKFSGIVSDIGGKAAIAGQTFTGDIEAPKITASTGILFGTDTAAANTLDDYEEGIFTPGFTFGVSFDGTFSSQVGVYTKIGNVVTVSLTIKLATKGTNTGDAIIRDLPFSTKNTADIDSITSIRAHDVSYSGSMVARAQPGGTFIRVLEMLEDGTDGGVDDTGFSDDSLVSLTLTYIAA